MGFPWSPGPVFQYEMLTASRRWQLYAGRGLLVAGLLLGLWIVWIDRYNMRNVTTFQGLAALSKAFFDSIMLVELSLALLAVPAATAGAVCVDKMRGGLLLMLATDLTDAEIVLGKLASRLVTLLSVLGCGLPVLAITSWLGGVDPMDSLGGTLVIVGLAVLAVSVTLTFSVWASRPHEALMATYAVWAVWLLAMPVWIWISPGPPGGTVSKAFAATHPLVLLVGNTDFISKRLGSILAIRAGFFVGSLAISAALAFLCIRRIRPVTLRQAEKSARATRSKRSVRRRWVRWPNVSLDRNPLLWREWHHSATTGMARTVWRLYMVLSTLFVVLALFVFSPNLGGTAAGGGVMVAIGLLFVSATAATRLAEERAYGSLDVLLATPLSSREIVLGKWWGAFRDVPRLAVLAAILAFGMYLFTHQDLLGAITFTVLLAGLVLAYGAVVTSVSLASAVWQPRLGRAIALSVILYLAVTVIYPFSIIFLFHAGPENVVLLWPSPLFGVFMHLERAGGNWRRYLLPFVLFRLAFLIAPTLLTAWFLRRITIRSFDRLHGRVPEKNEPRIGSRAFTKNAEIPANELESIGTEAIGAARPVFSSIVANE